MTAGDESDVGRELVGDVPDPRCTSNVGEHLHQPLVADRARRHRHPLLVEQVVHRHLSAFGQPVSSAHDDVCDVSPDVPDLEVARDGEG